MTYLNLYALLKNRGNLVGIRFVDDLGDFLDMTISQFSLCVNIDSVNTMDEKEVINTLIDQDIILCLEFDTTSSQYSGSYDESYKEIEVGNGLLDPSIDPKKYISVIYPNGIVRMKTPKFIDVSKYVDIFNRFTYGTSIANDFNAESIHAHWGIEGIRVALNTGYKTSLYDKVSLQLKRWLSDFGLEFGSQVKIKENLSEYLDIVIYINDEFIKTVKNLPEYKDPGINKHCLYYYDTIDEEKHFCSFLETTLGNIYMNHSDIDGSFKYETTQNLGNPKVVNKLDNWEKEFQKCFTQFKLAPYPNTVYIYFYKRKLCSSPNIMLEHDLIEKLAENKSEILREIVKNIYPVNGQAQEKHAYISYCLMEYEEWGVSEEELCQTIEREMDAIAFEDELFSNRKYSFEGFSVKVLKSGLISVGVIMEEYHLSYSDMGYNIYKMTDEDLLYYPI